MNQAAHSSIVFPLFALEERQSYLPLIKSAYSARGINYGESDSYIAFVDQTLRNLLPQDLVTVLSNNTNRDAIAGKMNAWKEQLPFLAWNDPEKAPCTLCISLIYYSDFTQGMGRYLCDALSRWLIPGKFLIIGSTRSLNFRFIASPQENLFFHQLLLSVDNERDLAIVRNNWPDMENEIRLSIHSVRHARQIATSDRFSSQQKKAIIEKNIASSIHRPGKALDNNVFDQMHLLLMHLSVEDKVQQIEQQLSPLIKEKPHVFDSDIFQEIKHAILQFGNHFTAQRSLKHISRLISCQYLLRKRLRHVIADSPQKSHFHLRVMKTRLSSGETVLGILGGMNVVHENELFEERHIVEAITHCLPHVRIIEDSFILEKRSHDPVRFFYLEIEKKEGTGFSLDEMSELKQSLPHALKESVESVLHPVVMPRNEEEIMRNICLLSQQLKYLNDLPQVVLSFEAQTEESLQFTVILLRILREGDLSLPEIFDRAQTELKLEELEVKNVALFRKRYPKEANVFKVSLHKKKFLRKDFTIDLFKARQEVSSELNRIFCGIRDFNGGILSKQQEALQKLRQLLGSHTSQQDFLVENFFYSLSPPLRQTLLLPTSLKTLFTLMQEAIHADYKKEIFFLKAEAEPNQLLIMAASPYGGIKEELFSLTAKLQIPSAELSSTHVNAHGISCIGYIYQCRDPAQGAQFYSALQHALSAWQMRLQKR